MKLFQNFSKIFEQKKNQTEKIYILIIIIIIFHILFDYKTGPIFTWEIVDILF